MVPVGECQNDFFIVKIFVWVFRVVYDQWTADTVWILATLVTMVPICAWLVDLYTYQPPLNFNSDTHLQ